MNRSANLGERSRSAPPLLGPEMEVTLVDPVRCENVDAVVGESTNDRSPEETRCSRDEHRWLVAPTRRQGQRRSRAALPRASRAQARRRQRRPLALARRPDRTTAATQAQLDDVAGE